jgi:hypothetical protein
MFTQPQDAQGYPVYDTTWGQKVDKVMTFAGGTANDPGDYDGTGNPATLFNVSGTVRMRVLAKCTVNLAGASATIEVGTALSTAGLIPLTTATEIDANEIWHDATTPDSSIEATTVLVEKIVSQDVIQTVKTANITAGSITYTCIWYPLSENAQVTAA